MNETPSDRISATIASMTDWRGEMLGRVRALILAADPDMVEMVKWVKPSNPSGVPTWDHAGIVCTGEVYNAYVKLTFAHGAALEDPTGLFNASLGGGTRRAINLREDETIPDEAFKALIAAAVTFNVARRDTKK